MAEYLYPRLRRAGLGDVDVYIWDHNKERLFDRACAEIDRHTDHMVAGLAFHWYSGDHFDALRLVREKFPGKSCSSPRGVLSIAASAGTSWPTPRCTPTICWATSARA